MNKNKKSFIINIIIFVVLIILIILATTIFNKKNQTTEGIAKCIGENSVLYIQLGCHACKTQEDMFGENLNYLEIVDCFYESKKCQSIKATPTWKIKGEYYEGVQSINKLRELTGC
jgi:hypothetical protein